MASTTPKEFGAATERYVTKLKDNAENAISQYETMVSSMQTLAANLNEAIDEDLIQIDYSDDDVVPLVTFSHPGGDLLADLRGESARLYIFESYADFDELEDAYFEREYYIYSDLSNAVPDLLNRLAQLVARYDYACLQEFSDNGDE